MSNEGAKKKLFLVKGKANNVFPGNYGDPLLVDFEKMVPAASPAEAIDQVFSAMQKAVDEFPAEMERWDEGASVLPPLPPDIPTARENWRAEEINLKDYDIVLRPIIRVPADH